MKEGPDIALIGALLGDPGRANMVLALMDGRHLTATELAQAAGVTAQTASTHLSRLEDGGLIARRRQGRHNYFALANAEVGAVIEAMMGLAVRSGHTRTRTGPRDAAMRKARICYDHLAGELGVRAFDSMIARGFLTDGGSTLDLTADGTAFLGSLGIEVAELRNARRPMCRSCLDWSVRRYHLAGSVGAALWDHVQHEGWAVREPNSRVVRFSPGGQAAFNRLFPH